MPSRVLDFFFYRRGVAAVSFQPRWTSMIAIFCVIVVGIEVLFIFFFSTFFSHSSIFRRVFEMIISTIRLDILQRVMHDLLVLNIALTDFLLFIVFA